jgi:hypothetical protein
MVASSERRRALFVAATVLVGYGYFFNHYEKIANPNETSRLYLTLSVVDEGTLAIDGPMKRYGVVWDRAEREGRYYSDKAPGLSFLAVPFYAAARGLTSLFGYELTMSGIQLVIRWSVVILPTVLLCYFLYQFLATLLPSPELRGLLVVLYAMATQARIYGTLFFGHQTAAVMSIGSVMLLVGVRKVPSLKGAAAVFLAGLLGGAAFATEYPTFVAVIAMGALSLFVARPWWRVLVFGAGVAIPVVLCLLYNQAAFGDPYSPGYAHLTTGFAAIHAKGLFGVTTPKPEALFGSFFSLGRGLFLYTPWLLAALPGFYWLWKVREWRPIFWTALLALVGYTYFVSSFGYWIGGDSAAPRHLTVLVPFLVFPVAALVNRVASARWDSPRLLLSTAFVFSLLLANFIAATFSYYSPQLENPFRDLTLEFWREGLLAPNLGHLVGLSGLWSAVPYALGVSALAIWAATATWEPGPGIRLRRILAGAYCLTGAALGLLVLVSVRPEGRNAWASHEVRRYMMVFTPPGERYVAEKEPTRSGLVLRGNNAMLDNRLDEAVRHYRAAMRAR